MAIDFPASPTLNDEYSFEGRTWLWNGTGWEVKPFVAPAGATGATGVVGVSGATGVVGVSGATGVQGLVGVTGATGVQGVVGVTGATGVIGISGATGVTGVVGISGATGVIGVSGATGATGVVGVSGATGVIGVSGATGATGATGVIGVSGATGPAGPNALAAGTATGPSLYFTGDDNTGLYSPGADQLAITTGGVEAMRLDSAGLGIGTSTPSHRLEVTRLGADQVITGVEPTTAILVTAGGGTTGSGAAITIAGGTAANASIFFGDTADGDIGGIIYSNVDNSLNFRTAGTNVAEFNSNGQLLLGGVTPGTASTYSICTIGRLQSQGSYDNTTASAANAFLSTTGLFVRSTSSIKYKTDVEDAELSYSEAIVFGSRPVWYRSLSESDPSEYSYWGFIAEEVAEIDPRMVHWGDDGPEGVQYDRYAVHLVNVIQKQQQRLDALEARLAALEAN